MSSLKISIFRIIFSVSVLLISFSLLGGELKLAGDWPMLAANQERTGSVKQDIRPPFTHKWFWTVPSLDSLSRTVQPVIAEGKVFAGTVGGILYCLDAGTGKELWHYTTENAVPLPIISTCAYEKGRVFFTSTDGGIYALDASTGKKLWRMQTGAPIICSPLVSDGVLFVAGREGYFYAVQCADGKEKWKYHVGAPTEQSPALAGNIIVSGAEDCVLRGIDAKNGAILWTFKVPFQSMRLSWPVISGNTVFIRGYSLAPQGNYIFTEEGMLKQSPKDWVKVQDMFRKYYQEHPEYRSMFIIDAKTGKEKALPGLGLIARHAETPFPPVLDSEGRAWLFYRTNCGEFKSCLGHFATEFPHGIGTIDTESGDIRQLLPHGKLDSPFRHCVDDASLFTFAGKVLFGNHVQINDGSYGWGVMDIGGIEEDLKTGKNEIAKFRTLNLGAPVVIHNMRPEIWNGGARAMNPDGPSNFNEGRVPISVAGDTLYENSLRGGILAVKGMVEQ